MVVFHNEKPPIWEWFKHLFMVKLGNLPTHFSATYPCGIGWESMRQWAPKGHLGIVTVAAFFLLAKESWRNGKQKVFPSHFSTSWLIGSPTIDYNNAHPGTAANQFAVLSLLWFKC